VILLDTHVLIWMSSDPAQLSSKARERIVDARRNTGLAIASITLWELAWLAEHQRVLYSGSVESFVRETVSRVAIKSMSPEIAAVAAHLPDTYPQDPSDRLIGSTAIAEGMTLVTADEKIRSSGMVECVW
jgi:PIN domain nuclease of toxin-antitoxin system